MEYECSDVDGEFMGILKGSLATTEIENEFVLELVDFVMN